MALQGTRSIHNTVLLNYFGLSPAKDMDLIKRTFESTEKYKNQSHDYIFSFLLSNFAHRKLMFFLVCQAFLLGGCIQSVLVRKKG